MTAPPQYKWFFETTTPVEGHMHAIARTIVSRQTKFQFMEILDTHSYGKCLILDGRIQSSQADEFIYHELLVQPGRNASGTCRRCTGVPSTIRAPGSCTRTPAPTWRRPPTAST